MVLIVLVTFIDLGLLAGVVVLGAPLLSVDNMKNQDLHQDTSTELMVGDVARADEDLQDVAQPLDPGLFEPNQFMDSSHSGIMEQDFADSTRAPQELFAQTPIVINEEIDLTDQGIDGVVSIKADATAATDCGPDPECFERRFALCEPAIVRIDVGGFVGVEYEILEQVEERCRVRSMFTQNPNPDWVGEEAVCLVDNTRSLEEAFPAAIQESPSVCTGPLYERLK